jgi:F0F1-type ATP synthase membrane subunit b/b'
MDIDVTFFMQLGLITALILVLRPLLATPLMRVMDERHQQTHGARAEVRRMERLTALDKEAYQTRLTKARHEIHKRREQQRQTGRDRAKAIETVARKEALQTVLVQRAKVAEAQKVALLAIGEKSPQRARLLAGKLLGREVRS